MSIKNKLTYYKIEMIRFAIFLILIISSIYVSRHNRLLLYTNHKYRFPYKKIKIERNLGHIQFDKTKGMIQCYKGRIREQYNKEIILKEYKGICTSMAKRRRFVSYQFKNNKNDLAIYNKSHIFKTHDLIRVNNSYQIYYKEPSIWMYDSIDTLTHQLSNYPYVIQHFVSLPLLDDESSFVNRSLFLKKVSKEIILSLIKIHQSGIVHGMLDSSSILLSTMNDANYKNVSILFQNFDWATQIMDINHTLMKQSGLFNPKQYYNNILEPFQYSKIIHETYSEFMIKKDFYDIAIILTELYFNAMHFPQPRNDVDKIRLKEQLEYYNYNMMMFRKWALSKYSHFVSIEFLDQNNGEGWEFLQALMDVRKSSNMSQTINDLHKNLFIK